MKRSVIILLVLIAFFAIPALASTPQSENAPAPTSEDTMFLGWQLLSDEELLAIIGNIIIDDASSPAGAPDLVQQLHTEWYEREQVKAMKTLNAKYISNKFNIPLMIAETLIPVIYEVMSWAIDQCNGNVSISNIVEYIAIGIMIADPELIAAVATGALIGLTTYTVTYLLTQ